MKMTMFSVVALMSLFAAVTFTACSEENDPNGQADAKLSVDKTSIAADIAAGTYTIAVTSDSAWTAAVNTTWCTVSPTSGSGNGTVTVSVTENPSTTQRTATVTVIRGTHSKQVSVAQAADPNPALAVNPATIEATVFAGTYTVEVTSIATWSSEVNAAATGWCSISPDWFAGNTTITVSVATNLDSVPRSALITLTSGTLKKQIVVNQVARTLEVNRTSIEAPAEGGTYPITVTADMEWVVASTATWYTVSPASGTGNGTVRVTVLQNFVSSERTEVITVTSGPLSKTVEITQGQGSGLSANGVLFYMVSVDGISATLTSFNIGMHEVTQSLWEAVMGTVISTTYGEGANYPVYNVSWNDIVGTSGSVGYTVNGTSYRTDGFYYKLSQLVGGGKQFRLPTEWEWEYAAKGGQQTHNYTYSGSNTIGDVAWYGENIPNYGTQVVGSKQANELGIYDMSGNVGEWCSGGDPYYSYIHVHRGGSWRSNAAGCAVADRSGYPASGIGFNYVGFRVVLSLP